MVLLFFNFGYLSNILLSNSTLFQVDLSTD